MFTDLELARCVGYGFALSEEAEKAGVERGLFTVVSRTVSEYQQTDKAKVILLEANLKEKREIWTLGLLIEALKKCSQDATVHFDFPEMLPTTFNSYRGWYDQLALGFDRHSYYGASSSPKKLEWPKVSELLERAQYAVGATYTGYKGGDYTMHKHTPVWVANYGDASCVGLVGIEGVEHSVTLLTEYLKT